ncbi:MAG TPA: VOC family protein [Dyella sp.]|nr:VOC family protein [Dyella sp.]
MKELVPYLDLGGRCAEALTFYTHCLAGEVVHRMRFANAPMDIPPELDERIMHSEFRGAGVHFMATDGMPGQPAPGAGNVSLCPVFDDAAEQMRVFDALVEGGSATQPLHDAFWGDRFGMLTDRFGQRWLLNCPRR